MNESEVKELQDAALSVRKLILDMAYTKKGGHHIGGGLSIVEIMCYLYGRFLNLCPEDVESHGRDRFILSKGHGVLGYFPVLYYYGYISRKVLESYKTPNGVLIAHPVKDTSLGIESSNGSLGQGLSYGAGIAYGLLQRENTARVIVLVGDGECNEGSIWEGIMSATSLGLRNLYLIVDNNSMQSDGTTKAIIDQGNLDERIASFGWDVQVVNGHSYNELERAMNVQTTKPKAIIANTIKGKGISFMEGNNSYHHASLTSNIHTQAMEDLIARYG